MPVDIRRVTSEFEIKSNDPFANDMLERKDQIESLNVFLSHLNSPFVLGIDSPWGTGKTVFVSIWKQVLEELDVQCVYINAWQSDYHDDPLITILAEIEEQLSEYLEDHADVKIALESAKKYGIAIAKNAIPLAVKLLTSGLLNINTDICNSLSDTAESIIDTKLLDIKSEKNQIDEFKRQIGLLAAKLRVNNKNEYPGLVIFIDELDRCRPTYSIELLERIKHLFDIDNITFVLSLDKSQLIHSICHVYGSGIDADIYLRRFIDLTYRLPREDVRSFCSGTYKMLGFAQLNRESVSYINDTMIELADIFSMSLRDIEQCYVRLKIAILQIPKGNSSLPTSLTMYVVLQQMFPGIYKKLLDRSLDYRELMRDIRKEIKLEFIYKYPGMEADFASRSKTPQKVNELLQYYQSKASENIMNTTEHKYYLDVHDDLKRQKHKHSSTLKYLLTLIEVVGQFHID
jgi:hypothetical protein